MAELKQADFTDARLRGAICVFTNFKEAKFSRAALDDVLLGRADLSGARFSSNGISPALGLTQKQLDEARADPENPPNLDGVRDAETGKHLVWRGRTLEGKPHPNPPPIPDD